MNFRLLPWLALLLLAGGALAPAQVPNGSFESSLDGWTADENWVAKSDSFGGAYSGWEGKSYAWSGNGGEATTGTLRSAYFQLDQPYVVLLLAGWDSPGGLGPSTWNYVSLKRADGREIDRVYAPNSLAFQTAFLSGVGHVGDIVFLEAVDRAAEKGFSMFALDDVRTSAAPPGAVPPFPEPVDLSQYHVLENGAYQVLIDREHGTIVRLRDKVGAADLLVEPRLAANYRICLPIPPTLTDPGFQANYFLGENQLLTAAEPTSQGLTLRWNGPLVNVEGTTYALSARLAVGLTPEGVSFHFAADNRTDLKIMEVWYPLLGGLRGLGTRTSTYLHIPWQKGEVNRDLFWNTRLPYDLGNPYPEYLYELDPKQMPESWMDIYSPFTKRGFYFGLHDRRAEGRKLLRVEMQPGVGRWRGGDTWPRPEELPADVPLGLTIGWVYFFAPDQAQPGNDFDGGTVVVRAHAGDWRAAAPYYPR